MLICAIDPGLRGAIAFLDPGSRALRIEDMPLAPKPNGKKALDLYRLGEILKPDLDEICPQRIVSLLEDAAPRQGEGVTTAFTSGRGFGAIEMALVGHGWERHRVTPAKWKARFGLSKDKGVSRALAAQRFPAASHYFTRVMDDGRAEAALIALYALETIL